MSDRITANDLRPGAEFTVQGQGTAITPQTRQVKIHWIGPDAVHYQLRAREDQPWPSTLYETSVERFLAILNGEDA